MNAAQTAFINIMRLFLIDYENVNSAGLHGIGQASKEDKIILFYSHAANTLSFEIMDEMMDAEILPERVCLEKTGKNAMETIPVSWEKVIPIVYDKYAEIIYNIKVKSS